MATASRRSSALRSDAALEDNPAGADGAADMPALEERFTFLFHRISARVANIGNIHFRTHQLNHYSARMLILLLEHKELRTGELVDLTLLPQSTISTQLLALHKRRLISRRRSRTDNRAVIVSLTPLGTTVARDCERLSVHVQDELARLFDARTFATGCGFLRRIEERLAQIEAQSPVVQFEA